MNSIVRPFAAALAVRFTPMQPGLCWASLPTSEVMPWDRPVDMIVAYLTGPATHTLAKLAFIAAATLYLITGDSNHGARQLARVGLGLTFALEAARVMNWLFPY